MFIMAANDCDMCQEGRLGGVRRGAGEGMQSCFTTLLIAYLPYLLRLAAQ